MQSPLATGAAALSGFLDSTAKKKQQALDQQRQQRQDAQAEADTQARIGLTKSQQAATAANQASEGADRRARLDLDTRRIGDEEAANAAAKAKTAKVDAFQAGGLHYPKNWTTMSPEAKVGYLQVRLNKAQQAGDTTTVRDTETEIGKVATQAEQTRRDVAQAKRDAHREAVDDKRLGQSQQRIQIQLDRPPANSTLSPYQAWEEKTFERTHNPDGTPKKAKTDKVPPVQDRRGADFAQGQSVIKAHPEHRDEVVRRYAAKYQLPYDKADELFGDDE